MKGFVVICVAILMLVKPLWPIAEYIANYEYIVNVLCENKDRPELECNGKCYLAQMLAKESEQDKTNPFGTKQLTEVYQILYAVPTFNLNSPHPLDYPKKANIGFLQCLSSFLFIAKIIQPPELP